MASPMSSVSSSTDAELKPVKLLRTVLKLPLSIALLIVLEVMTIIPLEMTVASEQSLTLLRTVLKVPLSIALVIE